MSFKLMELVLFGLSTICAMAEKSLLRGLIAGAIGLMLMTIGLDEIDGVQRLTFGSTQMLQGVNLLVAMIGLFAVPHIINVFVVFRKGEQKRIEATDVRAQLPSWRDLKDNFGLMCRSAGIGTWRLENDTIGEAPIFRTEDPAEAVAWAIGEAEVTGVAGAQPMRGGLWGMSPHSSP